MTPERTLTLLQCFRRTLQPVKSDDSGFCFLSRASRSADNTGSLAWAIRSGDVTPSSCRAPSDCFIFVLVVAGRVEANDTEDDSTVSAKDTVAGTTETTAGSDKPPIAGVGRPPHVELGVGPLGASAEISDSTTLSSLALADTFSGLRDNASAFPWVTRGLFHYGSVL